MPGVAQRFQLVVSWNFCRDTYNLVVDADMYLSSHDCRTNLSIKNEEPMSLLRNVRSHVISSAIVFALLMMTAVSAPLRAQGAPVADSRVPVSDIHFHKFQPKVAPEAASPSAVTRTQAEIDAFVGQQIGMLQQEKASRTPAQQKIDSNVLYTIRMMQGQPPAPGIPSLYTGVDLDDNNNIAVDMTANVSDQLLAQLRAAGAIILYTNAGYNRIRAIIPPNQIEGIAASPDVKFIAPKEEYVHGHIERGGDRSALARWRKVPGFAQREAKVRKTLTALLQKPNVILTGSGSVDTEGDITHRAFDARGVFGVNGAGLKIGVLSDSANATGALTSAQATGDMPPTCPGPGGPCVTVVQEGPGGASDEGTAMMEIIYDLAPGASLFFASADFGQASFAANILALRNTNNCDIIVDDVFYFAEPIFQDGIIAQAVSTVATSGAFYFSSAGNEGQVDAGTAGYFEGDFNDAGSPLFTFPGGAKTGTIHNFGGVNGDIVTASGSTYNLNWSDPQGASGNDYDLFVVSSGGIVKGSSTNIQSGTQNPYEQAPIGAFAAGDRLVVFKTTTAAIRAFGINTIRGLLTNVTTGQTHGHSAVTTPGVFSVAAAPAAGAFTLGAPVGPFPNPYTTANQVEPFSSDGPRRVFFNADGTPVSGAGLTFASGGFTSRNKPDITAADGVSTTLPGASGLNPFYGTSAAAPHAAAIAALVKSAQPTLTQAQLTTTLISTALDIMAAGNDRDSGNGIVMAYQAISSLGIPGQANPEIASVVASQNPGNGDGIIKAGEGAKVVIQLQNLSGVLNATGITATLASTTAGVTVLSPNTSSYANITAGTTGGTNLSPFKFVLASNFGCATTINFTLTVNYATGQTRTLNFTVPTGTINFTNNLGTTPTAITGFTTATGVQTGRVFRDGTPSVCGVPKAFPGFGGGGCATCTFDSYKFTPQSSGCMNSSLTSGTNTIFLAVYNGPFSPGSIGTNYTADAGFSSLSETCGISLVAGTAYTFVVSDESGTSVGAPYTLSLPACSILGTINQVPIAIVHNVTVTSAVPGGTAPASIDNGSNDPDGNPITIVQSPAGPYPHGVTSVLLTITDSFGAAAQASANVTVQDPAVGPDMTIAESHVGNFVQGQVGATYTITVTNSGNGPTSAFIGNGVPSLVTVVDTLPTGLTATAMAGTGWACTFGTGTCTRSDVLAAGASFPPITQTVTVAGNAPASVTNSVTVSGGGEVIVNNDTANNPTTILTPPTATLSTNALVFPITTVGTPSTAMPVTVTNNGQAPLNFTAAPSFSGTNPTDFTVGNTSTCVVGTPVAGGGSCVFNLVFTAGAAGPRGQATVTFTDNATPTTQGVTLNGTGADFGESGPGSPVTVTAGQTANFTITITPGTGGFPSVVTFSQTGAPTTGTTVTFSPPSETPGNVATSTTMMITTTSRAGITPGPGRRLPPGPLPLMLWTIAAALLAASLLMMRKNNYRRGLAWAGMAAVLVLVVAGIAGCNTKTVNPNGTPAGTSNITVTATSGTLSHTTVVTLTVQ